MCNYSPSSYFVQYHYKEGYISSIPVLHKTVLLDFMRTRKAYSLFFLVMANIELFAQGQKDLLSVQDSIFKQFELKEVVVSARQILGSKFQARNRTGSAYYVSPEECLKFGYTDINRMLKAVPGVNMYEEDGYGLRPNISLRGTKAERSERISIMEDGVLAAPAPYSAPAAYYFPTAARMHAIEILKGSSQVQYGPFTTGGAINMVSTPIPDKFSSRANFTYGNNNTLKGYGTVGAMYKHWGYMVEYLRYQSDGFKYYEDHDTEGFRKNDLVAKVIFTTANAIGANHAFALKYGYADEESDETYLGLSESDFHSTPFLRYQGSQMDNMTTGHHQFVATYLLDVLKNFKFSADAYYNYFHRNWYKLNDVRVGDTPDEKRSIAEILNDTEANHEYFDLLTGRSNRIGEAMMVRANNRTYKSQGIQGKAEYKFKAAGGYYYDLEMGLRYHVDQEDRFQWDDSYSMVGRKMQLFRAGIHGEQSNRITSAEAFAGYILGKLRFDNFTFTAGLRYEDVSLLKKDYGKDDLERTGKMRIETRNHAHAIIPSFGINYQIHYSTSVFFGVHKGFAPPSAELYQKPESSVNMEMGVRFSKGGLSAELIGFYNRYSNMLGSDLAATGGSGTLEQFNVGKANVRGLEFLLQYQPFPEEWKVKLPLQFSYTFTDTEMLNAFESPSWGRVISGDEIPYIYKHALNMQVSVSCKRVDFNLGFRYNSDMRAAPGQGVIAEREKVPAHLILDASAKIHVFKNISLFVNAVNLTDKVYLVSRHPSGLRAGHPFGISGGVSVQI